MKKLISLMLALILVVSMATVAFAADVDTSSWKSAADEVTYKLTKVYTVTGTHGDAMIVPQETLTFDVNALTEGAPAITVDSLEASDLAVVDGKITGTMVIKVPEYTEVGVYEYEIVEHAGAGQAVTYASEKVTLSVLVTYDYDKACLKSELILTSGPANDKLDTFNNKYDLGHMSVKKSVTGNLADKSVEFEMTVTLNSVNEVLSTITVADGNNSNGTTASIAPADWTKGENGYTATANIKVSDGETVYLYNIPNGVTYTVEEAAKHGVGDDGFDVNSAGDTDYTVSYANENGAIATNETKNVTVTNNKETSVATGITMDSVPFVLMLVVCAGAAVLFVTKRRSVEF